MSQTPASDLAAAAPIQRRTLTILVITQVVGTVGVGLAPSLGVLLAGQVMDNEAWAGLARTASNLGAAFLGMPLGTLAANRGRRVALSSGWWLAGLGSAILVAAAQWSLVVPLFIGLLLLGAGSAAALQARFAATDLAEPHRKARSLSLVVWVGTFGQVIGPNLGTPSAIVGRATGLTQIAGAFLIATVFLLAAGTIIFALLRPDPLLTLARLDDSTATSSSMRNPGRGRITRVFGEVRTNRLARIAVVAILVAQTVMAALMTMTPVHVVHHGGSVELVGITISLHILGMYALAPVVGWMTDRFGHRPTIWIGIAIFVASLAVAAWRPDSMAAVVVSLILLGLGWSFVNVAASALFAVAVSDEARASAQGGVDALANLCGALAAIAAGPFMVVAGFDGVSLVSLLLLVPLIWYVVRPLPESGPADGGAQDRVR